MFDEFLFFRSFAHLASATTSAACPTFGYCWMGMRTLSDSLMFLLLMTSRYFFMSPSFLSSSPSHFSISGRKKKKTKLGTADERSVVWASKSSDFVAVDIGDSRRVRFQIDAHQKVSILPFHVKDGEKLLFLLTPCNLSIKREISQMRGRLRAKAEQIEGGKLLFPTKTSVFHPTKCQANLINMIPQ